MNREKVVCIIKIITKIWTRVAWRLKLPEAMKFEENVGVSCFNRFSRCGFLKAAHSNELQTCTLVLSQSPPATCVVIRTNISVAAGYFSSYSWELSWIESIVWNKPAFKHDSDRFHNTKTLFRLVFAVVYFYKLFLECIQGI